VAIEDDSRIMPGKIEDLTVNGISFQISRELEIGSSIFVDFIQSAEVVRCLPSEEEGSESYIVVAKFANVNDRFLVAILAVVTDLIKKKSRRDT
jgi:hypothetical protein